MSTEEQKTNHPEEDFKEEKPLAEPSIESSKVPPVEAPVEPSVKLEDTELNQKPDITSNNIQQEKQEYTNSIHLTQDQLDPTSLPEHQPPSGILESTLDSLVTISSKINPFTHRIGQQFGQVRQYAQEKFGTAEDITELPQEYRHLEDKVDQLQHLYQNFLKVTKVYNTPYYDYPIKFTNTVTKQIYQLTNEANQHVQAPEHPKTLSHAMGQVASQCASELGKDEALRIALGKFASASNKVGNARLTMDHEVVSRFYEPLQSCLKTSIESANKARRIVHHKRLVLDAAKTNYRESSTANLNTARLEVEQAEDQFVGAVEEATLMMKTVVEDPELYRDLAEFVQVQLVYYREAQEAFSKLLPELQEIQKTQETIYESLISDI